MRRPHDVPLSKQAVKVLKEIWSLSDHGDLVLPAIRSPGRMLSENAMNSRAPKNGLYEGWRWYRTVSDLPRAPF